MPTHPPFIHHAGRASSLWLLVLLTLGACSPSAPESSEDLGALRTTRSALISVDAQLPEKSWFLDTTPIGTRHVSKSGSDYDGCGSTPSTACKSIHQALKNLPEGYEIQVQPHATPYAGITMTAASQNTSRPRRIRGAPSSSGQRVKIGPTADGSRPVTFSETASYWVLDNVDIDCGCTDPNSTTCTPPARSDRMAGVYVFYADHIALRNSEIRYCHDSGIAVLAGTHVTIDNNRIHDGKGTEFKGSTEVRSDGNAIVLSRGASYIHIVGNVAYDNSGDGVQCQGKEQETGSNYTDASNPKHITIESNEFYRNMENAVDLKTCWNVEIKGNNRFHSYSAGEEHWMTSADAAANCGGTAVVFHFGARNVLIEDARIYDSGTGISVGRYDLPGVSNIVIRRNRVYRMNQNVQTTWPRNFTTYNCGDGIKIHRGQDIEIYHNTVHDAKHGGILVRPSVNDPAYEDSSNIRIWNNIVSQVNDTAYPNDSSKIGGSLVYRPDNAVVGLWSEHNLFYHSRTSGPSFRFNGVSMNFGQWQSQTPHDDDNDSTGANVSSVGNPSFRNAGGSDFMLLSGSAGLNKARADDGNVGERCGSPAKPDRGALESDCSDDGDPNPPPPPPDAGVPISESEWTRQFGTASDEYGYGVATESAGNVYVTGYTQGSLDGTLSGTRDAFLRKYDAAGTKVWGGQLGRAGEQLGLSVAVDSANAAFVGGWSTGAVGTSYLGGTYDGFLAKYGGTGTLSWAINVGTSAEDMVNAVASDGTHAYVVGYTSGALTGTNAGFKDAFVAKYNGSGTRVWVRQLGTAADDVAYGAAADASGNVYVAGYTEGALDGTGAGGKDVFLAKYDANGTLLWLKQWGSGGDDIAWALALDSTGSVAMGGSTTGSLAEAHQGGMDAFVARWTGAGVLSWGKQLGTAEEEAAYGVTSDADGNVYLSGTHTGPLFTGHAGGYDVFLAQYQADGVREWVKHLGSTTDEVSRGVAASASAVYVVGGSRGALSNQTSAGGKDAFVAKFSGESQKAFWHAGNFRYLDAEFADLETFVNTLEHPYRLQSSPTTGGYGRVSTSRRTSFNTFLQSLFTAIDASMQDGNTGDWCDVKAKADLAGYTVKRFFDTGTGRWFVYGFDRTSNGQAYFFINPRAKRNVVIEAPHEGTSGNPGVELTAPTGARLFRGLAARALLINKENRCSDTDASVCDGTTRVCSADGSSQAYRESDVAHQEDNTFHELHKCFSDNPSSTSKCGFASRFVQLHGMQGSNDGTDWAEIGDGSYADVSSTAVSNTFAAHLDAQVNAADQAGIISCQEASGDPPSAQCGETNLQGRYTNGSADACGTGWSTSNGRFLHLELHATLRDDDDSDNMYWGDVRDAVNETWPTCEYFDGETDCTVGPRQKQYTGLSCPQ